MKISMISDPLFQAAMKQALKDNDNYCPCKPERTPDTKCICKEFRELASGVCSCGLYVKEGS